MGLLGDLLGNLKAGAKPAKRTIAQVEAALARLTREREAARTAVVKAMKQRDEALLIDDSDKRIRELDAVADRHRLKLERLERLEPILISELQSLRTEARRARWNELGAKYETASRNYAAALREAIERQGVMLALND